MKKIMFSDKFGLTQAVLDGRKTMTRRIIKCPITFRGEWVAGFNIHRSPSDKKIVGFPCMYDADEREFDMGEILPKYELGEVVAIAQSYMDVDRFHRKGKNAAYLEYLDSILPELKLYPGWGNKMFVKADLMPHHIKITGIKVERLQDISDEDCLKEGIIHVSTFLGQKIYHTPHVNGSYLSTNVAQEAFAYLIDKVSGKGVWESNPFVFAYEFVLFD
nr:MAG TPA: ASCH domain protein [Caudoviricetes sp.]